MSLKILLAGKTGQIGGELALLLSRRSEVIAPDRREFDLGNPDQIRRTIFEVRPQVIINAAAYTAVDQAEADETTALAINAKAPGVMAEAAKEIGAALVHYSTDYVFDGLKDSPYEESDAPNPINAYGRTKLAGERAIQASGAPHLIFRCAWVYATRGRNFVLSILRLATERDELRIVRDQTGAPTWSREIATATTRILGQLSRRMQGCGWTEGTGNIYHMTAAGETTWFDFAKTILEESRGVGMDTPWYAAATGGHAIRARRVIPIATSEYPTAARRPAYSVLSNARLERDFGFRPADWQTQLRAALRQGGSYSAQDGSAIHAGATGANT